MAQFSQCQSTVAERRRNKMKAGECLTPGETCPQSKPATKVPDTRTLLSLCLQLGHWNCLYCCIV